MRVRGLAWWAVWGAVVLVAGCSGGSGRSDTADLVVTGVGPSATLQGGDPAVFVMTVANSGENEARELTIRNVSQQLSPSTLTIACTADGGAACPPVLATTMTVSSLPPGGALRFEVSAAANAGASGSVVNTMSASSTTSDVNSANNSASVTVAVASNDVAVTVTPPAGPLVSGPATFAAQVSNAGPDAASNVVLTASGSAALTLVPSQIACTAAGGASAPAVQDDGTLVVASLPSGGTLDCSIPVTVLAGSGGFAIVSLEASSTGDARTGNNSGTGSVSSTLTNDVRVTGTAPAGPLVSGSATFGMQVMNAGPDRAQNVVLATSVSASLTLAREAITCAPTGGATVPALQADGTLLIADLPANAVLNCSIPVTVAPATNGFAVVNMTATSAFDSAPGNNSASASVSATLTNDVHVTAQAPAGPLTTGSATFVMTVGNKGPATATNVVLTNTLGANLSLASAITCTPAGAASAPVLQGDGTLLVASIPVNATLTCSVPVTVAPNTSATVFDSMTATATGDVVASNNSATASVAATLSNNVAVTGTAQSASVVGGSATTFTMVVTNSGPSTAFDVALTNAAGTNMSLSGAIACVAAGGATVPVVNTSGVLTAAAIPMGGTLTCTLPLTVAAGANGTVTSTFTATAAGDQRVADNSATVATVAVSSNLGVSQTVASQVAAGATTNFVALVSNPGPGTASNLRLTWSHTENAGLSFGTPTCSATGGATCPSSFGPSMSVASLGIGRTLTFTFPVTVAANYRGAIGNTLTVASDEDQDTSNNTASSTTQAVDARSGSYSVFAADGKAYTLSIDLDAGRYTLAGNGVNVERTFTPEGTSGDLVVSGATRLRTTEDMVIGHHNFGAGNVPFIAVRSFNQGVSSLAGSYNLATRNVTSAGVATTRPGTAVISGNTLTVCQNEGTDVVQVRNCAAASRKDYLNLTIANGVVTGTATTGETYSFSIANSGGTKVLLSAGPAPDGTQQMRIGLIDSTAGYTYGPAVRGPVSTGDWLSSTLASGSPPLFTSSGINGTSDAVSLLNIVNTGAGPFSMLEGTSPAYNALVYVMQAYPLIVVVGGAPGYAGASSGHLHIGLP